MGTCLLTIINIDSDTGKGSDIKLNDLLSILKNTPEINNRLSLPPSFHEIKQSINYQSQTPQIKIKVFYLLSTL